MDTLFETINKNPFREQCVPLFTKEKEELRQLVPKESLWGGGIRGLNPPRLTTAWLCLEDPLMILAGSNYRQTEVRDKTFELQQEASTSPSLKGNRKLSKAKVAEALASLKPSEEQTKVVAAVLYILRNIQTICFDDVKKSLWTYPEDLRLWSKEKKTLWVDSSCERFLEFEQEPKLGLWLGDREREGWSIPWPIADCSFEEMKFKMSDEFPEIIVRGSELNKKPKKDDYAKALGRCEAVKALR